MDRITTSLLNEFNQSLGIEVKDQTLDFEYFVNYSIISDTYGTNDFDLMDITTGPSTQGMDGIGIIVNQRLVMTTADIDELIELNQSMSVKFLIQVLQL